MTYRSLNLDVRPIGRIMIESVIESCSRIVGYYSTL